jgi:hypothetical protein
VAQAMTTAAAAQVAQAMTTAAAAQVVPRAVPRAMTITAISRLSFFSTGRFNRILSVVVETQLPYLLLHATQWRPNLYAKGIDRRSIQ